MKVLAFGEVLWDFIDGEKYFGGAPVNFAAHVVQCGEEAGIVTALGLDRLGDQALEKIKAFGLDHRFVQRDESRVTGKVMVILNEGQPTYRIKKDVAYDMIDESQIDMACVSQYDAFYFGTLIQRSPRSRKALIHILEKSNFRTVFYDVNLRRDSYTKEVIQDSMRYCTVVKMNHEEVETLSTLLYGTSMFPKLFANRLMEENGRLEIVLVTSGAKGCTVYSSTMEAEVPSEPVTVKDTVGAGDAFCAAFLTSYMKTNDAKKAARIGNTVGGFVASQSGAIPVYPDDFKRKLGFVNRGIIKAG